MAGEVEHTDEPIPARFSIVSYVVWHEQEYPEDAPLLDNLEKYRSELKQSSRPQLNVLGQLLEQIAERTEPECRLATNNLLTGEFDVPVDHLTAEATSDEYDLLFKSTSSIIEKMWRKNNAVRQGHPPVTVANLTSEITDLVRTSVVAPTLYHANALVQRMSRWRDILGSAVVNNNFAVIDHIDVDREAKLTSGYFAYHMLVWFQDGLCVEVQVYSQLISAWRNVSHKLYEQTRIGMNLENYPGSPTTLFVSLGHALHLIEWQLEQIVQELKKKV